MLIAARNSFMVGGKRLPYDAEVEYLESTGTQWIDTGVEFAADVGFQINGQFMETTDEEYPVLMGSQTSAEEVFKMAYEDIGLLWVQTFGGGHDNIAIVHVQISKFYAGFNYLGDGFATAYKDGEQPDRIPLYLFAMNMNIGIFCSIDEYGDGNFMSKARMYDAAISKGNSVVRDFIPVRVGNVGAIYDRRGVGGMNPDGSARDDGLYFNRGTGAFRIGPDK